MKSKTHVKKSLRVLFVLIIFSLYIHSSLTVLADTFDCAAGKHDYLIVKTDPAENNDGEETYTCRICGFSFIRILPATGHIWSEWVIDKQPTCTQPGHKHRICVKHANDPHRQEETLPASGHSRKETIIPSSCETAGQKIYTCERCGDTYTEPQEKAAGHRYIESVIKEPDCEHDGEKLFACEKCAYSYTEIIPALGHSFGEWIVDKEPTESEEGHRYKVCGHDGSYIIEEILPRLSAANAAAETRASDGKAPSFPNTADIILLSAMALLAASYGVPIFRNINILLWDKKRSMPLKEWLDKHHID